MALLAPAEHDWKGKPSEWLVGWSLYHVGNKYISVQVSLAPI